MTLGHEAVGRTSPPDAFSLVAVSGDHAPVAPAAETAAAEAKRPAAEPPQPGDDWGHWAQDVHHQCDREEVRCLDVLSQMPERN